MKFIGLSGVAKAGKDTFFQGLVAGYPEYTFTRLSVADIIREDISEFLYKQTGIDIFTCTPQEKEQVRPLLAWYGDFMRKRTKGMYFLQQLDSILDIHKTDYAVLTDLRFKEFEFDEPDWIRSKDGIVIHITRVLPDGTYAQPANELERVNDPKVHAIADHRVSWNTILPDVEFIKKIASITRTLVQL